MVNSRYETQIEIIVFHLICFIIFIKFFCNAGGKKTLTNSYHNVIV